MSARNANLALIMTCLLLAASPASAQDGYTQEHLRNRFGRERFQLDRAREGGRSITQSRIRRPDLRLLPRSTMRQTHRGWEVRTARYEVVAPTKSQAETAAAEFQKGWAMTSRLADRVGRDTGAFGFAVRSTVVFVDSEQKAQRRVNREYNNQDQYVIQLRSSGDVELAGQLHATASRAFLSASEWDRELPEWFVVGFSEWVAKRLADPGAENGSPAASPTVVGGPTSFRSARGVIEQQPIERTSAQETVTHLLESDGGSRAWQVFDALRAPGRPIDRLERLRMSATATMSGSTPGVSEPQVILEPVESKELRLLQSDLYALLRLAERERRGNPALAPSVSSIRVTEFRGGKAEELKLKAAALAQAAAQAEQMWKRRLRSALAARDWSLLTLDNDWLEQGQTMSIASRLDDRIQIRFEDDSWTISYDADGAQVIANWRKPTSADSIIQIATRSAQ